MRRAKGLIRESLLKKATRDFELAKKYKDTEELGTASLLYSSAIERVLKALVMERTKKKLPKRASIGYLAGKAGLPEDIYAEIAFISDNVADATEEELEMESHEKYDLGNADTVQYNNVLSKGSIVRRLISYASAAK